MRERGDLYGHPSAASPPTSWIFSHSGGFAVHRSLGNATPLPGWNAPRGYAATRFSLLRVPAARLSTDLRPLHERFTTPTCRRRRPAEKASACRPPPFGRDVHYVVQSEYRPGNPSKPRSARGVAAPDGGYSWLRCGCSEVTERSGIRSGATWRSGRCSPGTWH